MFVLYNTLYSIMKFGHLIPRGQNRFYIIIGAIVLLGLFAGLVDYLPAYNRVSSSLNEFLDDFDLPNEVTRQDRWGIFAFIDRNFRIPEFDKEYSLGLDLRGGVRVVYDIDVSNFETTAEKQDAVNAIRHIMERRVNFLGVGDATVSVQGGTDNPRLAIDIAGVSNSDQVVEDIGKTPVLEFRELREQEDYLEQLRALAQATQEADQEELGTNFSFLFAQQYLLDEDREIRPAEELEAICLGNNTTIINLFIDLSPNYATGGEGDPCFKKTELTGQYLDRASVDTNLIAPVVQLQFNSEGGELFKELTTNNISKPLAIVLDGQIISAPTVNAVITDGVAVIEGGFSWDEAHNLREELNSGALPVPLTLLTQNQIGASLGQESVDSGLVAGIAGVIAVLVFMILIYRFSGIVAVFSLLFYIAVLLALIKFIPVTLTLAGIAGLVLSIGMAVDANVLVFERLREELRKENKHIISAIDDAFTRTWTAVRDGNISTLITAFILFVIFDNFIRGFAVTLGLGIVVSMFSAMIVTRYFLKALAQTRLGNKRILWNRSLKL